MLVRRGDQRFQVLLPGETRHNTSSKPSAGGREKERRPRSLANMHRCAYTAIVDYEWDPKKAASNLRKHGVDFADAALVFEDEYAVTIEDDDPDEKRFVSIGMDALARILVVVYMWRGEKIRIISARDATPRERREYKEGL